ncbi:MAG: hypothetical protein JWN93_1156 [Hyphomicrobiales bacterium]|nr:hypothetical protein [Hyphomicrobiales bacterium]
MSVAHPAARTDLAEWSSPVVIDILSGAYSRQFASRPDLARPVSDAHFSLWRSLLSGELDAAHAKQKRFCEMARTVGLAPASIQEADRAVLLEVMQCVLTRYQRSPSAACAYTMTLVDAAACLAGARN